MSRRSLPLLVCSAVLLVAACEPSGTPGAPSGANGGGGTADGGTGGTGSGGGTASCLASRALADLGVESTLMVGGSMSDTTAAAAPFDFRYLYLAGGLFTSSEPCASCSAQCSASWWGCWQDPSAPPGAYVRSFVSRSAERGQLPMITYYEQLQTSGAAEGTPQVEAMDDVALMHRYFADWRFLLQQIGGARALLHVEPDLWGYMQHLNSNPSAIPVAVASANPTDCAEQPDTAVGFGRCLVKMARTYAPNARLGFHASAWASQRDVAYNTDPSLDVAGEARKVADFLLEVGADATDFIVIEASDRDAGYYESIGRQRWWDATNATLPNFHQAFAWARALTERMQLPSVWWQLPVGNMALPNVSGQWKDNRVEYFFAHPQEVAATNAIGIAFGAGATGQTTPESDQGLLVGRTKAYASAPQAACGTP